MKTTILIEIILFALFVRTQAQRFFFLVSIACDVLFASTKVSIIKYVFHFCLLCDLMIYNVLNERIFVVNIALQSAKL